MKRRRLVLGGAGLLAGAGGLWWALSHERQAEPAHEDLWSQTFPKADGGELHLSAFRGRPLVLNFWATWCPPCVREMPDLDRFQREFGPQGWQVVGLALDHAEAVRQFLARTPVRYAIGLAGPAGAELGRRLGNAKGGLPFTVVFDAQGRITHRKLGEADFEAMRGWVESA